jgi:hypothetical protein
MLALTRKVNAAAKPPGKAAAKPAPKAPANKPAAKPAFTMKSLRRLAVWASTAAAALFIAILAARSDVGAQRIAVAWSSMRYGAATTQLASSTAIPVAPRAFDAEAATRQLAQTVRGLAEDRERLTARLAAVEHNVEDITGAITRQSEAARTTTQAAPWPGDQPPVSATPATMAAVISPAEPPPAGLESPVTATAVPPDAAAPAAAPTLEYGVDLGGGLTTNALRARWAGIRSAHPQVFEGLQPMAAVRPAAHAGRTELRLVVGPLTSPQAAAQLCALLAPFRLSCRPTEFGGEHLALR